LDHFSPISDRLELSNSLNTKYKRKGHKTTCSSGFDLLEEYKTVEIKDE
jgi:hypothetical protein